MTGPVEATSEERHYLMGEARRSASAGGARPTGGHIRNTTLQVAQSLVFPPPFTMLDVYKQRLTRHLPFPPSPVLFLVSKNAKDGDPFLVFAL